MERYGESRASELISRLVNAIGARDELGVVPFVQAWPRIAGQDCAAHSQVMDVRNGTVLIGVDHPAWLQQLHLSQTRILTRIKREFPSLEAHYLHFTIVEHLDTVWAGETASASGETTSSSGATAEDDVSAQTGGEQSPTSDPHTDNAASAASDAGQPAAGGNTEQPDTADSDADFLRHLEGLRQALEERERERR